MAKGSINWMAGGPQGSGVDTAANIFGRACGYGGLYVFGRREYHSNIKGLHSYFHLRMSTEELLANVNDVDLLAAFDAETVVRHLNEVVPEGGIIVDSLQMNVKVLDIPTLPPEFKDELRKFMKERSVGETISDWLEYAKKNGVKVFPVPYMMLLNQIGQKLGVTQMSKITRMINVLTIGVSLALFKYDRELTEKAVRATFAEKGKIAEMNVIALNQAYEYAEQTFKDSFKHKLEKIDIKEERIFLTGNQAVAMGKVLGGCRVQTYYPITPAADESEYLEAHEILKTTGEDEAILVIQTEDEIAAINSASGACLAGARAATSTSGPGFSLMAEGLSWAGNSEVPVVVTYYQRGAPATGLPTRHGQDDLRFAMHAGHGEFPRIILASGDIKECFYDAAKVFNLAEKYQMPVIHLLDKAMANCSQTYPVFDYGKFRIDRGQILTEKDLEGKEYRRFLFTESGVSPRVPLGTKNGVHWYTGDEHNEEGHISEEPFNRIRMMEKRMKKLELVEKEVPLEDKLAFFGDRNSENVIVSWGSPKGAILEAIAMLKAEGLNAGFIQVRMISPFPADLINKALEGKKRIIDVEDNFSGQLGQVIREMTGVVPNFHVLKYTGRPMTTTEVYEALKAILTGKAPERQVLIFGS
ncbi:MAG TPA: 2-oxoacid:ferredoxin oxidoreductase subunit alpha [Candidatus Bathyarchaeia archaeon]|nr:2-oxoacid:ferredoxin oxidoreductase subunit alpha [Candidatus Bathyarchaeia archaeon]